MKGSRAKRAAAGADPHRAGRGATSRCGASRAGGARLRASYVFTTFPVLSETFYQREVETLARRPDDVALELHSLWRGGDAFAGLPVRRFAPRRLAAVFWWLPFWLAVRPGPVLRGLARLLRRPPPSWLNLAENLLGFAFALGEARALARARTDVVLAAWATAPGAAALLTHELTGIPFVLGAHAFDVFEHGGDWLLEEKLAAAARVVTSNEAARAALLERGARPDRTACIRRGIDPRALVPRATVLRRPRSPLRIVSVGRLVAKKGHRDQLRILAALAGAGFEFEARIVGDGPEAATLRREARRLGLGGRATFTGALPFEDVVRELEWADAMIFTGRVAPSGDRDGLPNAIAEAMAVGVPVVSTPVGGVPEAITDGETGLLVAAGNPGPWIAALARLRDDDALYARLRANARAWVERHFDVRANARALVEVAREAAASAPAGPPARGARAVPGRPAAPVGRER